MLRPDSKKMTSSSATRYSATNTNSVVHASKGIIPGRAECTVLYTPFTPRRLSLRGLAESHDDG